MSSICGLLWRDGRPVEAAQIGRMIESLAHWGPDATGAWCDGRVGFGHLALWSTPEARLERNPWRLDRASVVLTADARIDNRDDLMRDLGLGNPGGEVITDAELIVHAYLKWETGCAERLLGDFAFALWDARVRRLFCARDPMGMRPFFYFLDDRRFLFGSQVRAIFTDPEVPQDLNPLNLAMGLAGLQTFDDQTAFQAVRSLEPATALCLDERGFRSWKYWRLELTREIRFARDDDYVDAFEEILQRAVDARLRTGGRVGFMLSGGLDASTSLALALRGGRAPLEHCSAFSWALREDDDWWVPDERPFIEAFLRENPIDHHYVISDPARVFDVPDEVRRHGNGPEWRIDYCQMVPTLAEARRRGVRVILNGTGGDETASYAAYDHVLACLLRGDWPALRAEMTARAETSGRSPGRTLAGLIRPLLQPKRWRTPFNFQWTCRRLCERVADLSERGIPLPQQLADSIGLVDHVRNVVRPRLPGAWRAPLRADQIYILTQTHVISDQVNAWNYAASYGIEFRSPFLDRRVVEYAIAVPPRQHSYANCRRRLLRRLALRRLPAKISQRLDKSVTLPDLARGLAENEAALRERMARWRTAASIRRFVDLDRLESNLQRVVKAAKERSPEWTPGLPLCRGILLAIYLEDAEGRSFGFLPGR